MGEGFKLSPGVREFHSGNGEVIHYIVKKEKNMSKHDESQRVVGAIKVGDDVATPGVQGVVLAKGPVKSADNSTYARVILLTTVKGNDYTPFRTAMFYFDDDNWSWQSADGHSYRKLDVAVAGFERRAGVRA